MEEYLTATEASKELGISKERMALYCREGRLKPCIRKGKIWLISRTTLEAFKETRQSYKPGRPLKTTIPSIFWRENEPPSQEKAIRILFTRAPHWIPRMIDRSIANRYAHLGRTRLERVVRRNFIQGLYDPTT